MPLIMTMFNRYVLKAVMSMPQNKSEEANAVPLRFDYQEKLRQYPGESASQKR